MTPENVPIYELMVMAPWTHHQRSVHNYYLSNLALANKTMAEMTQPHRFHTLILEREERNSRLAACVQRRHNLFSQTKQLVLNNSDGTGLLEWMSSSEAWSVLPYFEPSALQSLLLIEVPALPQMILSWDGVPALFANIKKLWFIPVVILDQLPDLFAFLNLLPRLHDLKISFCGRMIEHAKVTKELALPLEVFSKVGCAIRVYRHDSSWISYSDEVMDALFQWFRWSRTQAIEKLVVDARSPEEFVTLINRNAATLLELRPLSWGWMSDHVSLCALHVENLPALRRMDFDLAYKWTGNHQQILRTFLPRCEQAQLSIIVRGAFQQSSIFERRFLGFCTSPKPFKDVPLDELLASCKQVTFDFLVWCLRDGEECLYTKESIEELFPQCHASGNLLVKLHFRNIRDSFKNSCA